MTLELCLYSNLQPRNRRIPARLRRFFPLTDCAPATGPNRRDASHLPLTDRAGGTSPFSSFATDSRHASRHRRRPGRRSRPGTRAAVGLAGPAADGVDHSGAPNCAAVASRFGRGAWQGRSAPGLDLIARAFDEIPEPLPVAIPKSNPGPGRSPVRRPRRIASGIPLRPPRCGGTIAADSSERAAVNSPSAGAFEEWLA